MLRGEFRFKNGLVIPNNVTTFGAQTILDLALRAHVADFYVGLCQGVYTPDLQIESLIEPTIGVNGYARLALARNDVDWPTAGLLNGQPYLESKDLVWLAVGAAFDKPITRMFIAPSADAVVGNLFCLSGALPAELTIGPDTIESDRTFNYRLYLR